MHGGERGHCSLLSRLVGVQEASQSCQQFICNLLYSTDFECVSFQLLQPATVALGVLNHLVQRSNNMPAATSHTIMALQDAVQVRNYLLFPIVFISLFSLHFVKF